MIFSVGKEILSSFIQLTIPFLMQRALNTMMYRIHYEITQILTQKTLNYSNKKYTIVCKIIINH
jgi:hypothetical protein